MVGFRDESMVGSFSEKSIIINSHFRGGGEFSKIMMQHTRFFITLSIP